MAETSEKQEFFQDHFVVRHPEGKSEKFPAPEDEGTVVRVGRELDNDIVLTDARASRYHAEFRRTGETLQVKDLNSANGTLISSNRIKPDSWEPIKAGQIIQVGETRITWEKAASSQSTIAMPAQKPAPGTIPPSPAAPAPAPAPAAPGRNALPWLIGLGVILLLIIVGGLGVLLGWFGRGEEIAGQPEEQIPSARTTDSGLALQTPGGGPTDTPTPSGPQLPIPSVRIVSSEVRPIVLGALPSTDQALLLVRVRVENVGNAPFTLSTDDFVLRTTDGETIPEAGGDTSEEGLRRLGAVDRFNNLTLTPGGSVPESLIFELDAETYQAELVFDAPDLDPIVLGLGTIPAGRELALALGTVLPEETPAVVAAETTPTPEPTPTATRPAAIPAPQVVPRSALVGTIAYPVYNGTDFDIYLGKVDGSGTRFYRAQASQPAFSHNGSRIAFHSWSGESRGLVTMDVSGANQNLIANSIEDQLPTWTVGGDEIIFLTRRTGSRQSQLIKIESSAELGEGVILGEGEYPTVGPTGELAFKGWGETAFGLRLATDSMEDIRTVTNVDEDTAPNLSPDGSQLVFMSRREENWDIYVIDADGSNLQRLTSDPANDGLPIWSPDGNVIAFVSNRGGPWAVWAMTPDGAGKRQLFTMEGSPDGFVGTDEFASRGWAEERISWTTADLE